MGAQPPEALRIRGTLLARNTLLNVVAQAVPLLVGVLTIPLVIRQLGSERFGVLALAWVVLGYFNIFDLGLGQATTKFVAEALGRGDRTRIAPIVWTAAMLQATLGIVGGLVLATLTPFLVERILNIPANLIAETRFAFYLLSLSVPVIITSHSFRGALEAAQRFDLVNMVRTPSSAANFLLPLVGVLLGWGLPGILALLVVSRTLALLVSYWLCARFFPSLRERPRFHWGQFRILVGFGGWVTVSSAVGPILLYLDRFMLGILLTMSAVTYYSAPYEMVTRLWIVPLSLVATLFPAFSSLGGERQWERVEALAARSLKYLLFLLGLPAVLLIITAHDLLRVWLGADFAQQSTLALQILTVAVLINSLALVPYSLLQAVGRPDLPAKFHLAELPLYVGLVWWLVSAGGIAGAALAWSIRVTIDTLLLFLAARRLSILSPRSLLAIKLPQTAALLVVFGGLAAAMVATVTAPWLGYTLLALLFLATLRTAWQFLLNEEERGQIRHLLRAQEAA